MATDNSAPHCPPELAPGVVVKRDEPSLALCDDYAMAYLREHMSEEEIRAEIHSICELAEKRSAYGIYGLLGLKPMKEGYCCVYSGESPLNWMHAHERQRLNHLKLALPSSSELAAAARQRIAARIAERKGRRKPSSDLHASANPYAGCAGQAAASIA